MNIVEPPGAASLMAIAAHPDDIESWCAGTLARCIDCGASARLLLVTSGEHGAPDQVMQAPEVAAIREREALAAGALLGLSDVAFLRCPDGGVADSRALRSELVAWIRRWRPDVVFTHDPEHPWPPYLSHRDHRIVGRAALDAVYPLAQRRDPPVPARNCAPWREATGLRDRLAFAEHAHQGLKPHAVRELWLFASDAADSCVDIRAGFDRKIAARLAHASQTPEPAALPASWRARAARIGEAAGLPLAEAFKVLRLE